MIKRTIGKISMSYFAALRSFAPLRETKPALVTPVMHRCVARMSPFGTIRSSAVLLFCFLHFSFLNAQQKTYCNPINIDYGYTPIPNFTESGRHRATADPVIVNYKGDYYLFSTNQWGYWWSNDMLHWNFNSRKFLRPWNTGTYDELCAPAVGIIGDTMVGGNSRDVKSAKVNWLK